MIPITFLLGWLLIAVAFAFMIWSNVLDRRMQAYRHPSAPEEAFTFVPVRWRAELYVGDGPALVKQAWRAAYVSLILSALGALLVAI